MMINNIVQKGRYFMVRPIGEFESLNEMAIINPKMCKQLSIQVEVEQRDEGPVPHVHVYLDKTK